MSALKLFWFLASCTFWGSLAALEDKHWHSVAGFFPPYKSICDTVLEHKLPLSLLIHLRKNGHVSYTTGEI